MEQENKKPPMKMRFIFGLFMVAVYLGMGFLVLSNFFDWIDGWVKYAIGSLLIIYGFWRGYREFKAKE